MELENRSFKKGNIIPKKYTYSGLNISPEIKWDNPPDGTKSFVLIVDDPDAPAGNWVHWLVYNVPAQKHALPENIDGIPNLKDGTLQGINDFRKIGYGGPAPPHGSGPHRYIFKLYALDTVLNLPPGANKTEIERAMTGHILETTQIIGQYEE